MKKLSLVILIVVSLAQVISVAEPQLPIHAIEVEKIKEVNVADGLIGLDEILGIKKFINFRREIVNEEKIYKEVIARVTAYAPFDNKSGMCADDSPHSTSIGYKPSSEYIAVDPNKIPYGTTVYIDGYGMTEAGDTGGALRLYNGYAIDVYFDTYEEAIDWGVKYIKIKIYD